MNRKQRRAVAKLGSPVTQLLASAVRLHQAGQLVAAEASYRQVLAAQPNLTEGHSNLGSRTPAASRRTSIRKPWPGAHRFVIAGFHASASAAAAGLGADVVAAVSATEAVLS
jgi:hypothetical protein